MILSPVEKIRLIHTEQHAEAMKPRFLAQDALYQGQIVGPTITFEQKIGGPVTADVMAKIHGLPPTPND